MIKTLKNSLLARNSLWMILGQGFGMFVQAGYFVLIARALGSHGYGAFIGVVSLVGVLAPFSGMGSGSLLIKKVARDAGLFGRCWGNALLLLAVSALILLVAVLGVAQLVFPAAIPLSLVLAVALSDLFFTRVLALCEQAYQAFQRLHRTALLQAFPNVFKLLAIALLQVAVDRPSALQWGCLYLLCSMVSSLIGVWLVNRELHAPVFTLAEMNRELLEGFYFSVSHSARGINNDIDKAMLARFSTLEITGIYGAAYRIIAVAFTPILSVLFAAYAKFFQHGSKGVQGTLAFARRIFPVAGGYALLVGLLLCFASPLLPRVLGPGYAETATALIWLAPLPFLKSVQFFAGDALTGAGFQGSRTLLQLLVALFNFAVNLWLIPAFGWRGAAWASIASDSLLALLTVLLLLRLSAKRVEAA